MANFDVDGARNAGYSDDEIVNFLARDGKVRFNFAGARDAGYSSSEILDNLKRNPPKQAETKSTSAPAKADTLVDVSGVVNPVLQGIADVASGVGETLKQYTPLSGAAETAKGVGQRVAPAGYKRSEVIAPKTSEDQSLISRVQPSELPKAVGEALPAMGAGAIAARVLGRVHPLAGALAAAGTYGATVLGNRAKERAVARTGDPNAEPTAEDKTAVIPSTAGEAALGGAGATRFIPGVGRASTVAGALGQGALTTGIEGAVGAGQSALAQAGRTAGTPGGLKVSPDELAEAALVQGATGGALSASRVSREMRDARKFGGYEQTSAERVAADLKDASQGNLKSPKVGFQAVSDLFDNYRNELKTEVKGLSNVPTAVDNAINRARKGKVLTDEDLDAVRSFGNQRVASLVEDLHTVALLKSSADFNTARRTFTGGVAHAMERSVRAIQNPLGATTAGLLGATVGGANMGAMFTMAPPALATLAGIYGLARLRDRAVVARAPAASFVNRFDNPNAAPRPAMATAPTQQGQPQVPPGPAMGPWGPWGGPAGRVPIVPPTAAAPQAPAAAPAPAAPRPTIPTGPGPTGPGPALNPAAGATAAQAVNSARALATIRQVLSEEPPARATPAEAQAPALTPPSPEPPAVPRPVKVVKAKGKVKETTAAPVEAPPAVPAQPAAGAAPLTLPPPEVPVSIATPTPKDRPYASLIEQAIADRGMVPVPNRRNERRLGPERLSAADQEALLPPEAPVVAAKAKAKAKKAEKPVPGSSTVAQLPVKETAEGSSPSPAATAPDWMTVRHDKAHLDPWEAARAIADKMEADGKPIRNRGGLVGYIARVLGEKNPVAAELSRLTGIDEGRMREELWGLKDRESARETLDKLVQHSPDNADAIRSAFEPNIDRWWKPAKEPETKTEPPTPVAAVKAKAVAARVKKEKKLEDLNGQSVKRLSADERGTLNKKIARTLGVPEGADLVQASIALLQNREKAKSLGDLDLPDFLKRKR